MSIQGMPLNVGGGRTQCRIVSHDEGILKSTQLETCETSVNKAWDSKYLGCEFKPHSEQHVGLLSKALYHNYSTLPRLLLNAGKVTY